MPISQQVRSFTGGEWSPDLWQRDDLERFTTANQICRNCIPQPTGGVQNRWGLYYAGQTRFGATQSGRLWTFMFSTQQAFGLCFENKILRFWFLFTFLFGLPLVYGLIYGCNRSEERRVGKEC